VLRGIATIGLLTRQAEALALLDEGLAHKTVRVRLAACRAIAEVVSVKAGRDLGLRRSWCSKWRC
jgi:hypothetical protein